MSIRCKSCNAPIIFIKTRKGKSMPCDAKPVRFDLEIKGRDLIVTEDGDVVRGRISKDGADTGYKSHYASCPHAAEYRNAGKKAQS